MKYQYTSILLLFFVILVVTPKSVIVNVKKMIEEINKARNNPSSYATLIQNEIKAHVVDCKHQQWNLVYSECLTAIDEAISFLNAQSSLPALSLDQGLTRSAYDHSVWQNQNGVIDHVGENNSDLQTRIEKHSTWTGTISENLIRADSSVFKSEQILIMSLIIDDGVSGRDHRQNLFSSEITKVGIGISADSSGRDLVTQIFASNTNCNDCSTYTDEINFNMCWTDFQAGNYKCGNSTTTQLTVSPQNPNGPETVINENGGQELTEKGQKQLDEENKKIKWNLAVRTVIGLAAIGTIAFIFFKFKSVILMESIILT